MNISSAGFDLIKEFEGCRLDAYLDSVGVPTIGYGHIEGVHMGDKITQEFADQMLMEDVGAKVIGVNKLLKVQVTQPQFDALVSFAFNLGLGNLKASTLLRKINAGEADQCGDEFLRWNRAAGVELAGLTRRREAERDLFNTEVA
jgi:lysozyme